MMTCLIWAAGKTLKRKTFNLAYKYYFPISFPIFPYFQSLHPLFASQEAYMRRAGIKQCLGRRWWRVGHAVDRDWSSWTDLNSRDQDGLSVWILRGSLHHLFVFFPFASHLRNHLVLFSSTCVTPRFYNTKYDAKSPEFWSSIEMPDRPDKESLVSSHLGIVFPVFFLFKDRNSSNYKHPKSSHTHKISQNKTQFYTLFIFIPPFFSVSKTTCKSPIGL